MENKEIAHEIIGKPIYDELNSEQKEVLSAALLKSFIDYKKAHIKPKKNRCK